MFLAGEPVKLLSTPLPLPEIGEAAARDDDDGDLELKFPVCRGLYAVFPCWEPL